MLNGVMPPTPGSMGVFYCKKCKKTFMAKRKPFKGLSVLFGCANTAKCPYCGRKAKSMDGIIIH